MSYPNPHFRLTPDIAWQILVDRGFGYLVAADAQGRLASTALPIAPAPGRPRTIDCHIAANNPMNDVLETSMHGLLIASAGDAYIRPAWYGMGPEQVPTWLHISVEAEVRIERLPVAEIGEHTIAISERFEPAAPDAWHPRQMRAERYAAMLRHIVGYRLTVIRLSGQRKLSQHKPDAAIRGMTAGLHAQGGWAAQPILAALAVLPANQERSPAAED